MLSIVLGVGLIAYSLFTNYELGVWKIAPMAVHNLFESAPARCSPSRRGCSASRTTARKVWAPFLVVGIAAVLPRPDHEAAGRLQLPQDGHRHVVIVDSTRGPRSGRGWPELEIRGQACQARHGWHSRFPQARFSPVSASSPIGDGATGTVYLAESPDGSRVALKVLAPELARDERFRQRFLQESRLASGLDNPHIVPTLTSGEEDGLLYLAMAYVEGSDLRQILRAEHALCAGTCSRPRATGSRRPLPCPRSRPHPSGREAGEHPRRRLDPGRARLGLRLRARAAHLLGQQPHRRPRLRWDDRLRVARADRGRLNRPSGSTLNSLACVLYEAIGGVRPFERESELSVVYAHLIEAAAPITHVKPELPSAMERRVRHSTGEITRRPLCDLRRARRGGESGSAR